MAATNEGWTPGASHTWRVGRGTITIRQGQVPGLFEVAVDCEHATTTGDLLVNAQLAASKWTRVAAIGEAIAALVQVHDEGCSCTDMPAGRLN